MALENDILGTLQEEILNTIYSSATIPDTKKRSRSDTPQKSPIKKKKKIEDTNNQENEEWKELKKQNFELQEQIRKLQTKYNILNFELENSNAELNLHKKRELYVCF